tara:strand:+ start:823 stop:1062 length:240 start_codon:yes stop_codon:yes gene_type:complete
VNQYKERIKLMTMIAVYPSKKVLKENIGKPLKYRETSMFGEEYKDNGTIVVVNRPHMTGIGHEFFAEVTMKDGLISKVK